MKYIIITPVKDEEKYIRFTIESIIAQTVLPSKWIIVDDGSTDNTLKILQEYEKEYSWIKIIPSKTQKEKRSGGSKVVRAFNKGIKTVDVNDYDFIVKLDGDLQLPSNYFEIIIKEFKADPKLGLCGGVILNKYGNRFIKEKSAKYHIRGAFKSIRKECYIEIGGFKEVWNWDGLDEMTAMYKGWKTKVVETLEVKHYRPTTSAYNLKEHSYRSGIDAYKMRSNILLLLIRGLLKMGKSPYIIYGFYYWKGFFDAMVKNESHIIDKGLGKFINKFHMKRLRIF